MSPTLSSERRAELMQQLTAGLNAITLQDLRMAARTWGWSLRGTTKADIVQQMADYFSNAALMRSAVSQLPPAEQEALVWLSHLTVRGEVAPVVQHLLRAAGNHSITDADAQKIARDLWQRGLLIPDVYGGLRVSELFTEWLPLLEAPGLRHMAEATPEPPLRADDLARFLFHLLKAVERETPPLNTRQPEAPAAMSPLPRGVIVLLPRSGLVADAILQQWGLIAENDRARARCLLDLALRLHLIQINLRTQPRRLEVVPQEVARWAELSVFRQRERLRDAWLGRGQLSQTSGLAQIAPWNELDLALTQIPLETFTYRQMANWYAREVLDNEVVGLRILLHNLIQPLRENRWFSFRSFADLVRGLRHDLLPGVQSYGIWRWYRGNTALDPAKMDTDTWLAIYGRLLEAWLAGPATWLGLVQVSRERGQIVAFCRLPADEEALAPIAVETRGDLVRFLPDGTIEVRNTWQLGDLRQLIRQIAVEAARSRDTTTYRLDAAAFRAALRSGQDADRIAEAFARAGNPLPSAVQETLHTWQSRAGRYQLYDNLAVVEFGDDQALAEIRATGILQGLQVHVVSPRCLVVLNPEAVSRLIEDLRKKGYMPQVVT